MEKSFPECLTKPAALPTVRYWAHRQFWNSPMSLRYLDDQVSLTAGSSFLMLSFTFLDRRVFSPGPALFASPEHKCYSRAPRKNPAHPQFQPHQADQPCRGSHADLWDPPCRFWVLLGHLANLRKENAPKQIYKGRAVTRNLCDTMSKYDLVS